MRSLWDHQCVIVGHHGVVEGATFVIVMIISGSMVIGEGGGAGGGLLRAVPLDRPCYYQTHG